MPPGRKRRTKVLAGSGESAASTVVDDSTSGGEGETSGATGAVRSPPRSKARLGSPRKDDVSGGGSGSCGGSAGVASAEKAVTRAGSPRNVGGKEGGSGRAIVASTEKAVAREGESEGGSGSRGGKASVATTVKTVAQPSKTVGKESGAGRAKEAAKKREYSRGAAVVGGGAVSHVAAAKRITGELNELVFEAGNFDVGTAKGLVELASKYEALLMTVITENAHLRGQVEALRGSCGGHSSTPSRSMPAPSAPMPAPPAPVLEAIAPVAPKPVETWSVVVRSKGPATSSKEVIQKVVKEQYGVSAGNADSNTVSIQEIFDCQDEP
ncbi:dermokine-like [Bactrocera dorsalis]|uniref:Dermokine-like n=1 Tax=Bactrocera dorsalis TaxID=27457 RepID=A0ABM3J171_BACDO|nr:dermokine-like [Bactrocera dorsalis]